MSVQHQAEVASGQRFEFGANWAAFLKSLDDERIALATTSLSSMLGERSLAGKTFIDVGSGSGLFSLAARRLGARVLSFDYDPQSVACTRELRQRFFPDDPDWVVAEGSVLDPGYLQGLGRFDVVYSWGVLHHTGAMWQALANVVPLVGEQGKLFIAIYNDQGPQSLRWLRLKQVYNRLPRLLKPLYATLVMGARELRFLATATMRGRPDRYFRERRRYKEAGLRGMSYYHDLVDWIGGYPFEVAKPEQIFDFYRARGFSLLRLTTCAGGLGCNEFVFQRDAASQA